MQHTALLYYTECVYTSCLLWFQAVLRPTNSATTSTTRRDRWADTAVLFTKGPKSARTRNATLSEYWARRNFRENKKKIFKIKNYQESKVSPLPPRAEKIRQHFQEKNRFSKMYYFENSPIPSPKNVYYRVAFPILCVPGLILDGTVKY